MSSKFSDVVSRIREVREVEPGKQTELEKGDMKALLIAATEVFAPVLLGMLAFFALLIGVLIFLWS